MNHALSMFRHYGRAFRETVEVNGWRFALRRTARFMRGRVRSRLPRGPSAAAARESAPPFQGILDTLPVAPVPRPLLLIISDIRIQQCVHYRIRQKLRYLEEAGLQALHLHPAETGRLRAFLGLAHSVIIYRTALPNEFMQEFRDAGAQLIFEFDDLVVGPAALEKSGILSQITAGEAVNLLALSRELLRTAQACDSIIVSTPHLKELYARPGSGLDEKPAFVVPNFVETDTYDPPRNKDVTFAYTSPSGSIRRELEMLRGFLTGYDAAAERDWSVLVMGNDLARKALEEIPFRRGRVIGQPYSAFEDYLESIARAETVLIPLSDNDFNRAKTAIRLMDAAISGTQALFCPVGAYRSIQTALRDDSLCIPSDAWGEAGARIGPVLARLEANVGDLQQAVRRVYGTAAARSCYRQVFLDGLHMPGAAGGERRDAA